MPVHANVAADAAAVGGGADAPLAVRRGMGSSERFMYLAEQTYGGTFRIGAVLTLRAPAPLTAAALTAAITTVAARHDALRTVVVRGDTFAVAPAAAAAPAIDVKAVSAGAGGVTAAAFADAQAVLAAGPEGSWANPPPSAAGGAVPATPDRLPWRAAVYVPAPGVAHAPADAAAVVYYLPHYLSDGTSVDVLSAATVDALTAAASTGGGDPATTAAVAAAGGVVPLAPAADDVYPPPGGPLLGMAAGVARFLAGEVAAPLTRSPSRSTGRACSPTRARWCRSTCPSMDGWARLRGGG